jgi:hypothetical protein
MATKRGKKVRVFCSNYKRLPVIFFLYIALCLISTPSSTWAAYIYTELLPPGWDWGYATGINNKGDVIGNGSDGTNNKPFLYSKGVYTELLPPGWDFASAYHLNDKGDVIVYTNTTSTEGIFIYGFLYSRGVYTELLAPGRPSTRPEGINNKGDVILLGVDGHGANYEVFLYSRGNYTKLLPLGWARARYPTGINNKGDVIGYGYKTEQDRDPAKYTGFLYSRGGYTELLPLVGIGPVLLSSTIKEM